jgi:hypothetical protein
MRFGDRRNCHLTNARERFKMGHLRNETGTDHA